MTPPIANMLSYTNYAGNTVEAQEYEYFGRRVREYDDGSMLVEVKSGRFRDFPPNHVVCRQIRAGLPLSNLQTKLRLSSSGTHEPVKYYVNAEGEIGVPPEPNLPPPDDVTVHEARTLADIDRLSSQMSEQAYRKFQDDGVATEHFEGMLGNPRQKLMDSLTSGNLSNKGKDVVRGLIEDLDREADNRQKITTRFGFRFRDYDD